MILNDITVLELLKKHLDRPEDWILEARKNHKELKALIDGEGFSELLEKIEHIEGNQRALARKKYAKDIRDLFSRVMKKRENVFQANGGSVKLLIDNETLKEKFESYESNFKSNKSLYQYLNEFYFKLADTDPNGLVFLEYNSDSKLYPTYKSINDIRYYKDDGQICEVVIFEPKLLDNASTREFRIVDDLKEWFIVENSGVLVINQEKSFEHPFGKVPALILSEKEKVGTKIRLSYINDALELAKDYARDKSILNIYKFQNGFPLHWRYVSQCRSCNGSGKIQDLQNNVYNSCGSCDGKGYISRGDVTDMVTLPLPKEGQPNIAPNIAGFIAPDLETWRQYKDDLRDFETLIEDTIWGTDKTTQREKTQQKTATETFIDVQPISNSLNIYSQVIEYVHNTLANWVLNFIDPIKDKDERLFFISYGRRYIIEGADVVLEKYQKAKKEGDNNTILDKLLEEFILSKYKSDPYMQAINLKKIACEPYVHLSVKEVNDLYGVDESLKKVLFEKFWQDVNTDLPKEEIINQFNIYYTNERSKISTPTNKGQ